MSVTDIYQSQACKNIFFFFPRQFFNRIFLLRIPILLNKNIGHGRPLSPMCSAAFVDARFARPAELGLNVVEILFWDIISPLP